MDVSIERMTRGDWAAVRAIYEEGIATGHATFESTVPEWGQWDADHVPDPYFTRDFDGALDLIEHCADALLDDLERS